MSCTPGNVSCCDDCDLEITDQDVESLRAQRAAANRSEFEFRFRVALDHLERVTSDAIAQVGNETAEGFRFARTLTNIQTEWDNVSRSDDFWLSPSAMIKFGDRISLAIESIQAETATATLDETWFSDWRATVESIARNAADIGGKFESVISAVPGFAGNLGVLAWGVAAVVLLWYLGPAAGRYASKRAA